MKTVIAQTLKLIIILFFALQLNEAIAQTCTPQGDQTAYGTNNTWIGYVYRGMNFENYKGFVTAGSSTSPDFDQSFGGDNVQYGTNGCEVYTDTFSVRYKLTKTFTDGNYVITVGGDDGYRLSIDGGATWVINNWGDHSYTTSTSTIALNGTYNLVFEYFEHFINNRVSFKMTAPCLSNTNTADYGAGSWIGYVYEGMNFNFYKGTISEGSVSNPNFDESFGGDNVTLNTSGCSINTNNFSVRYRMQRTLQAGTYVITVGGDDGYRLSLDGGATWVINKWVDQGYGITTYTANLSGVYNMVLEYYENGGGNRISFNMTASMLPIKLLSFTASVEKENKAKLNWKCAEATDFSHFAIMKSADGRNFQEIAVIAGKENEAAAQSYSFNDKTAISGSAYYRIAMVDKNGSVTYSSVIMLTAAAGSATRIYPTLVDNGSLFVESGSLPEQAKLDIFDMNGRKVFSQNLASKQVRQQVTLALSAGKSTGSYVARISGDQTIVMSQLIVIK